uniref:Transmembrane protein 230 n=1 Tax=Macrostomum lignano TaxID=282301 RepID=A0A1I8H8C2_9PLAT
MQAGGASQAAGSFDSQCLQQPRLSDYGTVGEEADGVQEHRARILERELEDCMSAVTQLHCEAWHRESLRYVPRCIAMEDIHWKIHAGMATVAKAEGEEMQPLADANANHNRMPHFLSVLCSIGAALTAKQPSALYNLVFVIGGLVIFVPGIYYLVYIIRAYQGHDGYSFEDLPPMD